MEDNEWWGEACEWTELEQLAGLARHATQLLEDTSGVAICWDQEEWACELLAAYMLVPWPERYEGVDTLEIAQIHDVEPWVVDFRRAAALLEPWLVEERYR